MADAVSTTNPSRRGFLRGLTMLPLIGGGVTLIGNPTATAVPVSQKLIDSYKAWLHFEHRMLSYEMAGYDQEVAQFVEDCHHTTNDGGGWHFQWSVPGARGPAGWIDAPQPSTRAALVLSAVGCPLPNT